MNIFLIIFIHVQCTYIVISTAQTDLGLRSRTFSLKINKWPTFSEVTQEWQCLMIVFIQFIRSFMCDDINKSCILLSG